MDSTSFRCLFYGSDNTELSWMSNQIYLADVDGDSDPNLSLLIFLVKGVNTFI
jgi:hypothetical protein